MRQKDGIIVKTNEGSKKHAGIITTTEARL